MGFGSKKIKINCSGSIAVKLEDLKDIQGTFKSIGDEQRDKLINSFLENGFCDPFLIWRNNGENIVLSGNQRLKALLYAKEQGYSLPSEFPANEANPKNEKKAREMILSLAGSFGKVTKESFNEFISEFELDLDGILDKVNFEHINFSEVLDQEQTEKTKTNEIEYIKIPFLRDDFANAEDLFLKARAKIEAINGVSDMDVSSCFLEILKEFLKK